jgi:FLVCR family MFS transporter
MPKMANDLDAPLIDTTTYGSINAPKEQAKKPKFVRFYMLAVFFLACFSQGITWTPLSALPDAAKIYWPCLSDSLIFWSLNMATIVYVPISFISPWLLTTPNGMQRSVQVGVAFSLLSAAVRVPAAMAGPSFRASPWCNALMQLGGAFCGIAGPFTQGSPSRFSAIWFPPEERTRATAIAFLGTYIGSAASYVISPALVQTPDQMPLLIYIEFGLAFLPFFCVAVYFPDSPEAMAATDGSLKGCGDEDELNEGCGDKDELSFIKGCKRLLKVPAFTMLVMSAGLLHGMFACWSAALPILLRPFGYTNTKADGFAFVSTVTYTLGTYLGGELADRFMRGRLKGCLLLLLFLTTGSFIAFGLTIPSVVSAAPLIPPSYNTLMALLSVNGLVTGATAPMFLELAAEVTYPIPEGSSGNLVGLFINAWHILGFGLFPYISPQAVNLFMAVVYVLCLLLMVPVAEKYLRWEAKGALGK